jgi:hypothetical protein
VCVCVILEQIRGRLHVRVRFSIRFAAHTISHTIRIGAYFKFKRKIEWAWVGFGLGYKSNANRMVSGRLHVLISVQIRLRIGVRIPELFGAQVIFNWTRFNFPGNIIFSLLVDSNAPNWTHFFWETSFLPSYFVKCYFCPA